VNPVWSDAEKLFRDKGGNTTGEFFIIDRIFSAQNYIKISSLESIDVRD
jgi:hypothetical protein